MVRRCLQEGDLAFYPPLLISRVSPPRKPKMQTDIEIGTTDLPSRIAGNIQQLNVLVQRFEQHANKIGSTEDGENAKHTRISLKQEINQMTAQTNAMLQELTHAGADAFGGAARQAKIQRERLANDLMTVLNRLQAAQRIAAAREQQTMRSVAIEDSKLSSEEAPEQQGQLQMQKQHQINLAEIRERQMALNQLEQDIGDVNQIFKDLARIVHEQGDMVDSIEANVEHAQMHVEQGSQNVQRALHYQTKARQKKLILLAFFIAFLFIAILVIYLYLK
uniref:t-SNARE coiled-coil homology domain-containing protein n=1 Tax=Steinernema glaseri TaxID=37863 RepID=A0A1I8AH87_9BILA